MAVTTLVQSIEFSVPFWAAAVSFKNQDKRWAVQFITLFISAAATQNLFINGHV